MKARMTGLTVTQDGVLKSPQWPHPPWWLRRGRLVVTSPKLAPITTPISATATDEYSGRNSKSSPPPTSTVRITTVTHTRRVIDTDVGSG